MMKLIKNASTGSSRICPGFRQPDFRVIDPEN